MLSMEQKTLFKQQEESLILTEQAIERLEEATAAALRIKDLNGNDTNLKHILKFKNQAERSSGEAVADLKTGSELLEQERELLEQAVKTASKQPIFANKFSLIFSVITGGLASFVVFFCFLYFGFGVQAIESNLIIKNARNNGIYFQPEGVVILQRNQLKKLKTEKYDGFVIYYKNEES